MVAKKKAKAENQTVEYERHPAPMDGGKLDEAEDIIRDLVAIVQSVAPGRDFSAVLRAERYLAGKKA